MVEPTIPHTPTRIYLSVYANGNGDIKCTQLSLLAYLMWGGLDNELKWPFDSHVVFQVCMHSTPRQVPLWTHQDNKCQRISPVTRTEIAETWWGWDLIPHNHLHFNPTNNCQCLKNDFQIIDAEILAEPGMLLTELTKLCKAHDRQWLLDLHAILHTPTGTRCDSNVSANGWGGGEDAYISVFAPWYKESSTINSNAYGWSEGHVTVRCNTQPFAR